MTKASLLSYDENKRTYKSSSGSVIIMELDDTWSEIIFTNSKGDQIGEFEFQELDSGNYKLTRMYTNESKLGGIGRAALEFFKDVTGALIYTSPHDGIVRDDGSHLTGDAPGFVNKMIDEGLIQEDLDEIEDENQFFD